MDAPGEGARPRYPVSMSTVEGPFSRVQCEISICGVLSLIAFDRSHPYVPRQLQTGYITQIEYITTPT